MDTKKFLVASPGMMTVTFAVVDVFLWAARFAVAGGVAGHVLGMGRGE